MKFLNTVFRSRAFLLYSMGGSWMLSEEKWHGSICILGVWSGKWVLNWRNPNERERYYSYSLLVRSKWQQPYKFVIIWVLKSWTIHPINFNDFIILLKCFLNQTFACTVISHSPLPSLIQLYFCCTKPLLLWELCLWYKSVVTSALWNDILLPPFVIYLCGYYQ